MWLRFVFFSDRPSILAAVGLDGNVYFMASDVGKFLGYKDVYQFSIRYGTKNLMDLVPQRSLPIQTYKYGIPVLDFVDMIATIRKTFCNHKMPFDEKNISRLTALWYFGSVDNQPIKHYPSLSNSPKYAQSLHVKPGKITCMSLQGWIRQFVKLQKCFGGNNSKAASILYNYLSKKRKNDDDQHKTKRACLTSEELSAPPYIHRIISPASVDGLTKPCTPPLSVSSINVDLPAPDSLNDSPPLFAEPNDLNVLTPNC